LLLRRNAAMVCLHRPDYHMQFLRNLSCFPNRMARNLSAA
jgi:hypothetical protein